MADPAVPEAGLNDKSGVHRGADWEFLTVVTANPGRSADLSAVTPGCTPRPRHAHDRQPALRLHFHGVERLGIGEIKAEASATSGNLLPRLTLSGATGQLLVQSDSGLIVQALSLERTCSVFQTQRAAGATASRRRYTQIAADPFAPLPSARAPIPIAYGDLTGDGIQDVVTANRIDDTVSVFLSNGDGTFQPP